MIVRGARPTAGAGRTVAAVELDARLRAARNTCELLRGALTGAEAERLERLGGHLDAAAGLAPEALEAEADAAYTAGLRAGWREAGVNVDDVERAGW